MKQMMGILVLVFLVFAALHFYSKYQLPQGESPWPPHGEWHRFRASVGGRLLEVESPLSQPDADPAAIKDLLKSLQNPFVLQDYPWGTQSTGWFKAWSAEASPYVVAASNTSDIVAAVNFARKNELKLVIKGTGHDYLGRSNAPHSLLVWTHHMRGITIHEAFIPEGAPAEKESVPAVTIEAGARWIEVYQKVTTQHGRYVQGGGCTTVGAVGGFLQGGGFGSFSKKYGIAAASLLEAEVVIANGDVLIANEYQNADLFWALKGGGGGTFGIVTKATLETYELPNYFGLLQGKIVAKSDKAFKELLEVFIHFYRENLNNEHWGEQVIIKPDNSLDLSLTFQGFNKSKAEEIWKPFQQWIIQQPEQYTIDFNFVALPANKLWDEEYLRQYFPDLIKPYHSNNGEAFYWASNQNEVLAYWYTYQSRWLPIALFEKEAVRGLAHTLFNASRDWEFSLHFNKGLAGASEEAIRRSKETSINPIVLDSAALVIFGAMEQNVFSGLSGHEPNIKKGEGAIQKIDAAVKIITAATPNSGTYSNEANYFQQNWQSDFWGKHYPRLLEIKKKYDPDGFFQCHHCVGSE